MTAPPDPSLVLTPAVSRIIFVVLPLMYLAGIIGLQVPALEPFFRPLIPFNLLASLALLLLFHTDWNRSFLLYCVVAFCVGFLVEVAGVHTGMIFGSYQYGTALGWQVWEVPLVIGTNWLMLTYVCGSVCDRLRVPAWAKALTAAGLMTGLDILIEPVAIRLGFWDWDSAEVPLQNYLAWYIISAFLLLLFYRLRFRKNNRLAFLLLLLQFLFFGISALFII